MGTTVLAANAIVLKVLSIGSYFIDGFAYATESLAGVFWGQNNRSSLRKLVRLDCLSSLLVAFVLVILVLIFPKALYGLLTDHESVIEMATRFSPWLIGVLGLGAIAYALDGYFLGLTQGRILRDSTLLAFLLGFLPCGMVAYHFESAHGLWMAMVGLMGMRAWTLARCVPETLRN